MNKNIISSEEAHLLFDKLISGNVLVTVSFTSLTGFRIQFTGVLDKKSSVTQGVLVNGTSAANDSLMVPLFNRGTEFSYCDSREIPPGLENVATKFGDTVLMIRLFVLDNPDEV